MNKENTFYICYGELDGIGLHQVSGKLVPNRTDMFIHPDYEGFFRVSDLDTGCLIAKDVDVATAVKKAIQRIDRNPEHTAEARAKAERRLVGACLTFPINLLPIKHYKKRSL